MSPILAHYMPIILEQGGGMCVAIPGLSRDGHTHVPPCPSIPRFPSNLAIPGLSRDGHTHISPPCPSIPGFPSNLAIPGLSQDGHTHASPLCPSMMGMGKYGGHVCGHPWTIPGRLSYLGIPGYLDNGGHVCVTIRGQSRNG